MSSIAWNEFRLNDRYETKRVYRMFKGAKQKVDGKIYFMGTLLDLERHLLCGWLAKLDSPQKIA